MSIFTFSSYPVAFEKSSLIHFDAPDYHETLEPSSQISEVLGHLQLYVRKYI